MGMGHKNDRIGELNSFWLIIDQLAVAFYVTIPTEVLMIIEGEFHQNFVFVCPLYTLVNFACFLSSAFFFKIFQKYHQSVKQFGSRSGPISYYHYM